MWALSQGSQKQAPTSMLARCWGSVLF
ncbi:hypothetical protein LINPERPRIM_LOCUS3818 [Linum perenne]